MTINFGVSSTLLLTAVIVCIGSSGLIGYNLAVINLPVAHVKNFLNQTVLGGSTGAVSIEFLYALCNAIFVVGGALGAFSSGWIADKIGRRNGLWVNNIFAFVGGILCSLCVHFQAPALLYIGRFITGINGGISIGVASMYLIEIAPLSKRGAVGAFHQLAVTIGICLAFFMTLSWSLNGPTTWPIAMAFNPILAFCSFVGLPFCPESPRYLYSKKKDEPAARQAFDRLNSGENTDTLIGELCEENELADSEPEFRFVHLFTKKELRMAVFLACSFQIMQQLSGINAVISYSSIILLAAGLNPEVSQYATLSIGILNVIVTIISLPLLERAGRRSLLLWPSLVLIISLVCLTITVTCSENDGPKAVSYISIVLILVYIVGFALGLGPVPALIVSELFRQAPRAAAYSLSQSLQWTANLLVLLTYPSIAEAIGGYAFLIFFVITTGFFLVFVFFMPETKNKTFDEVARDLAFGNVVFGKRGAKFESNTMAVFSKAEEGDNNEGGVHIEPLLKTDPARRV